MKKIIIVLVLLFGLSGFSQSASKVNNAQNVNVVNHDPDVLLSCDPIYSGLFKVNIKDSIHWQPFNIDGLDTFVNSNEMDPLFNAKFTTKTTSDLSEGSNLYYTNARFDTRFSSKSTSDLTEGSNLYYTDTRARNSISLTTTGQNGVATYSTGVFNIPNYSAPSGTIVFFAGTSAPTGYLLCDGSAVSRTTYGALFAVIDSTYGSGDGSTTFNLPDLRQRFPLGKSASGTGSTLGGTGGTIDHLHTVDPPSTATGAPSATVAATILAGGAASTTHTHTVDISVFNSGTANPPYLSLNAIIKY